MLGGQDLPPAADFANGYRHKSEANLDPNLSPSDREISNYLRDQQSSPIRYFPAASHGHLASEIDVGCSQLEPPKLKDLKSHSFPPPWASESHEEEEDGTEVAAASSNDSSSLESTLQLVSSSAIGSSGYVPFGEEDEASSAAAAEERRRRWLLYSQTISTGGSGYVSE